MARGASTKIIDDSWAEARNFESKMTKWQIGDEVGEAELRNQLQLLILEAKAVKAKVSVDRQETLVKTSKVTAERLHRAIAFLAVQLEDTAVDTADVEVVLESHRKQAEYKHHQWFEYQSQAGLKSLTCCRACGAVRPRQPLLQDLPCRGFVGLSLRG